MSEYAERSLIHGAPKLVQPVPAVTEDETSLLEAFENAMKMSQDVGTIELEDTKEPERHEQLACSTVAETPSTETKWEVGAQCQAVWSEDGLMYPAAVMAVDGERCRVRFTGYDNEEDMDLSALHPPKTVLKTQSQNSQDWKPGSRCRAVFSEDGLVYPAVVLWVEGQRCRVRFEDYNNEEDQDINSLLNPDELYGPSRANAKQGNTWKPSSTRSNPGKKWMRKREETQREREEKQSTWRDNLQNYTWLVKKTPQNWSESQSANNKESGKPTKHSFSLFPPFPPQSGLGDPMSFIPPRPLLTSSGDKSSSSASDETLSSMLMLWYMCGFHTGSYMAQQLFGPTSKD